MGLCSAAQCSYQNQQQLLSTIAYTITILYSQPKNSTEQKQNRTELQMIFLIIDFLWIPFHSNLLYENRFALQFNNKTITSNEKQKKNWFSRFCCRELLFYLSAAAESEEEHLSPHHFTLELEYSTATATIFFAMVGKTTYHFLWWLVWLRKMFYGRLMGRFAILAMHLYLILIKFSESAPADATRLIILHSQWFGHAIDIKITWLWW